MNMVRQQRFQTNNGINKWLATKADELEITEQVHELAEKQQVTLAQIALRGSGGKESWRPLLWGLKAKLSILMTRSVLLS